MHTILVTAFDPFGGESVNPALEAVIALPDEINGVEIVKQKLPTSYGEGMCLLLQMLETERPDAVISVGQADGRANITIERVAINIADSTIADNDGGIFTDEPIVPNGPAAYFSTLPIKEMVNDLHQAGIPASISNTAGTFVCNHIMYAALHYAAVINPSMKTGFVHVPYLPIQTLSKPNAPSMSLENIAKGLEIIIQTAIR